MRRPLNVGKKSHIISLFFLALPLILLVFPKRTRVRIKYASAKSFYSLNCFLIVKDIFATLKIAGELAGLSGRFNLPYWELWRYFSFPSYIRFTEPTSSENSSSIHPEKTKIQKQLLQITQYDQCNRGQLSVRIYFQYMHIIHSIKHYSLSKSKCFLFLLSSAAWASLLACKKRSYLVG